MTNCLSKREKLSLDILCKEFLLQKILLLLLLFFSSSILFAQKIITGKATATDSVLQGVSVHIKGTNITTQTDDQGQYNISASSVGTLVFSHIGFNTQEVKINSRSVVNVQLKSD